MEDSKLVFKQSIKEESENNLEGIEQQVNKQKENGLIDVEEKDNGVILVPTEQGLEEKQYQGLTPHSSGNENYISDDRSTSGTPWQTHLIKLDYDNTQLAQEVMLGRIGLESGAATIATKFGPKGYIVAAALAVLAFQDGISVSRLDHEKGDTGDRELGVQFTFRWARNCTDIPVVPGEVCLGFSENPQIVEDAIGILTGRVSDVESQ
ncbi:hypothetical protein [Natrarchaeobaculum aegyptiacum]|uniref:hypothetical protein n=1 Tax=Natrarchaeobaculum aegyptiacum TaxID=745377 RepID=UPI00126030E9|nr:hypothetical protein [Natrarchaeobaculum aegyptiacum]